MSDEYRGPERRHMDIDPDMSAKIATIDERTAWIVKAIEKLATVERVQAVEGRVDRHIKSHVSAAGLYATWAGIAVAIGVGLMGMFKQ